MAHDLTETAAFGAVITVPDDGDDRVAASVQLPFQQLANRTRRLDTHASQDFQVGRDITALRDVNVVRNLAVGFDAILSGALVTYGEAIFDSSPVLVTDTLEVLGEATFEAPLAANGSLSVAGGPLTTNNGAFLAGASSLAGTLSMAGTGRILRRTVIGANADTTYHPANQDQVIVRAGGITADRIYTVNGVGATNGHWIRFSCNDPTYQINVSTPGPLVCSIGGALTFQYVECELVAGVWTFVSAGQLPT